MIKKNIQVTAAFTHLEEKSQNSKTLWFVDSSAQIGVISWVVHNMHLQDNNLTSIKYMI